MRKYILIAMLVISAGFAQSAKVNWQSDSQINSESVVSTNGDLRYAYNFGSFTGTQHNGVYFAATSQAASVPVGDNNEITFQNTDNADDSNFAFYTSPLIGLLESARWAKSANSGAAEIVTLNGLTAGHTYELQLFSADRNWNQNLVLDGGTDNEYTSANDTKNGIAVIGTFVADSDPTSFSYQSSVNDRNANLNGLQLRTIAIPEPATLGLLGLMSGAICMIRRRFC